MLCGVVFMGASVLGCVGSVPEPGASKSGFRDSGSSGSDGGFDVGADHMLGPVGSTPQRRLMAQACDVPQQLSWSVELPDEDANNLGLAAAGFVAAAALVLGRVALCRRAWGELPVYDERENDVVGGVALAQNTLLAPNWRNWFMLLAVLADAFLCAAPGFLPQVPWLTYFPLKYMARVATLSGVWVAPVFVALLACLVAATLCVGLAVLLGNYNVSVAGLCPCRRKPSTDLPELLNVAVERDGARATSPRMSPRATPGNQSPHAAAVTHYERTAVSARDPRDGGYWQPRSTLSSTASLALYLLSTVLMVPFLMLLAQVWTCSFPFASASAGGDCDHCWTLSHLILCAATAVVLMALLPMVTIGFVSQQRLDAEEVAAVDAPPAPRTTHTARPNLSGFVGGGAAVVSGPGASPKSASGSPVMAGAVARTNTRTAVARAVAADMTAQPRVSLQGVLQLQQRTAYINILAVCKVMLAVAGVFVARMSVDAALLAVAVVNSCLLAYVWRFGAFCTVKFDIIARLAHLFAAAVAWLLVVNHSFVFAAPGLRFWGGEVAAQTSLAAANSDDAVAGHAVVVCTAGILFLLLVACIIAFRSTLAAKYGSATLFATSVYGACAPGCLGDAWAVWRLFLLTRWPCRVQWCGPRKRAGTVPSSAAGPPRVRSAARCPVASARATAATRRCGALPAGGHGRPGSRRCPRACSKKRRRCRAARALVAATCSTNT